MTSHELAKLLLEGEDLPVAINGWGSDEGFMYEVTKVDKRESFNCYPAGSVVYQPMDVLCMNYD